jgi:hypothetical protein
MERGNRHLGKITGQHSRPQFHLSLLGFLTSYGRRATWWRKWERLKIMGGGQGSHNRPTDCGACGAYAPGPDDEEDKEDCCTWQLSKCFIHPEHCNSAFLYADIEEVFYISCRW